jgi:hypothetical protein
MVVINSQPLVSGKRRVTHVAMRGRIAKPTGGIHGATSFNSIINGAIIDPTRAIIEENPTAAFLRTVGNNSVQYRYTTTNTIKLATTPILAHITDQTPAGLTANISKHSAVIKLKIITIVRLPKILSSGMDKSVPSKVTLALAATLINVSPLS